MINIKANIGKALQALDRAGHLESELSSLLTQVINAFKREVQLNIETQGATFESKWKPASKWIIAKKGSSKLFEGAQHRVRVRNAPGRAEIIFDSPGDWTLTQHQGGFYKFPTGEFVTLDLKNPSVLGVTNTKFSFLSHRESRVPPRRMWPQQARAKKSATPIVEAWAKAQEKRIVA